MKRGKNSKRIIGEIVNKKLIGKIDKQELTNLAKLATSRDKTEDLPILAETNGEFTKKWYEQYAGWGKE